MRVARCGAGESAWHKKAPRHLPAAPLVQIIFPNAGIIPIRLTVGGVYWPPSQPGYPSSRRTFVPSVKAPCMIPGVAPLLK